MDIRKIGFALILIGITVTVIFINNPMFFVPALTVTTLGFFLALLGYLTEVRKRKIINDRLDEDIVNIIQPMITKYSDLNKQYKSQCSEEEYVEKRLQLNKLSLSKQLSFLKRINQSNKFFSLFSFIYLYYN